MFWFIATELIYLGWLLLEHIKGGRSCCKRTVKDKTKTTRSSSLLVGSLSPFFEKIPNCYFLPAHDQCSTYHLPNKGWKYNFVCKFV